MSDAAEPKDAGTILRKRRTLRGHSLEAVHQHTRIPKNMLKALEENDPTPFPAPVYMRGFLKNYCEFLEIEFDPLWAQLAPKTDTPLPTHKAEAAKRTARPIAAVLTKMTPRQAAVCAGVILISAIILWAVFSRDKDPDAGEPVSRKKGDIEFESTQTGSVRAVFFAQADTFLRLKIDGTLKFDGKVPTGSKQEWDVRSNVMLRTPNPEAIQLTFGTRDISLQKIPADSGGWRTIDR